MRYTVNLLVEELPAALRRTADFLGESPLRLEHLTLTPGRPARLTATFAPNAATAAVDRFAEAVRGRLERDGAMRSDPGSAPYHWQADGAGDDHVD
ncbi:MAG: hypothetical protein KF785_15745 [Gemmatimonadales bacterium]|nr:hypothetical protein [Gemmatimonadales bacterium]